MNQLDSYWFEVQHLLSQLVILVHLSYHLILHYIVGILGVGISSEVLIDLVHSVEISTNVRPIVTLNRISATWMVLSPVSNVNHLVIKAQIMLALGHLVS